MRLLGITAVSLASLLCACGGDDTSQPADTADTTGVVDDVLVLPDVVTFDTATGVDTAVPMDTTEPGDGGAGSFGSPCVENHDCLSGWCVTSDMGPVCSRLCTAECPDDWNCVGISGQTDVTFLCIPRQDRLCQACALDGQCNTGYCLTLAEGRRCTADCNDNEDCPPGYTCQLEESEDAPGRISMQCVPTNGACDCIPGKEGFIEACSVANDAGTCFGVRTCMGAAGWSDCDAQTPAEEVCDGVDNNCNRLIDEGLGGEPCDITSTFGTCVGATLCQGAAGLTCIGQTPAAELCNFIDDDCDGQTDEGFPNLGQVCSAGEGGCERFGTVTCTADGSGTVCNAQPGTPTAELCNFVDDDCDGETDEDFANVGQVCHAGLGVCLRFGVNTCTADGLGTECNVQPGQPGVETCNLQDDDCNGITDDGFLVNGKYSRDDACGNCFTDCTTIFARPNAFGVCNTTPATPVCRMDCEPNFFDLNAVPDDGCEFSLDTTAIYVGKDSPGAAAGACGLGPLGTGTGHFPCDAIGEGIARAIATGRTRLIIADGLYTEEVAVVNGISMLGGYRADTWERHLSSTGTIIRGVDGPGDRKALSAIGVDQPTVIEGLVVSAANAVTTSANTYAFYIRDSTGQLTVRSNLVFAGLGGPGGTGTAGSSGQNGVAGSAGAPTKNLNTCSGTPNNPGGAGGVRMCANPANPAQTTTVSGGKGGDSVCPAKEKQEGGGTNGQISGGAGGAGGWGHEQVNPDCFPSAGGPETGVEGADALVNLANDGASGTGCTNGLGTIAGNEWRGLSGSVGGHGGHGAGGGGGGAGSGNRLISPSAGFDISGSGGGGGSGGCAGARGGGGAPGGGSFGVFVLWTAGNQPTSAAGVPSITGNVITRNQGGPGGTGGNGGAGGDPGAGALGGPLATHKGPAFCVFGGAKGGFGARGGHGGGGGGACGGTSYDIFAWGINGQGHGFAANFFPLGGTDTGGSAGSGGNSSNTTRNGAPGLGGVSGTIRIVD